MPILKTPPLPVNPILNSVPLPRLFHLELTLVIGHWILIPLLLAPSPSDVAPPQKRTPWPDQRPKNLPALTRIPWCVSRLRKRPAPTTPRLARWIRQAQNSRLGQKLGRFCHFRPEKPSFSRFRPKIGTFKLPGAPEAPKTPKWTANKRKITQMGRSGARRPSFCPFFPEITARRALTRSPALRYSCVQRAFLPAAERPKQIGGQRPTYARKGWEHEMNARSETGAAIDRRAFLKLAGGALGALALGQALPALGVEPDWTDVGGEADFPENQPVFLKDRLAFVVRRPTVCTACRRVHPPAAARAWSGECVRSAPATMRLRRCRVVVAGPRGIPCRNAAKAKRRVWLGCDSAAGGAQRRETSGRRRGARRRRRRRPWRLGVAQRGVVAAVAVVPDGRAGGVERRRPWPQAASSPARTSPTPPQAIRGCRSVDPPWGGACAINVPAFQHDDGAGAFGGGARCRQASPRTSRRRCQQPRQFARGARRTRAACRRGRLRAAARR